MSHDKFQISDNRLLYINQKFKGQYKMNELTDNNQYLQKTITIKTEHINQLIEQLKMTQQLHSKLKKKYLNEERGFKQKYSTLHKIVQELKTENTQFTKKHKQLQCIIKRLQSQLKKKSQNWQQNQRKLTETVEILKTKNEQLQLQNRQLLYRLNKKQTENQENEQNINSLKIKIKELQSQVQIENKKYQAKELQWNKNLVIALKAEQSRNKETKKNALDSIQAKIKGIMLNI